MEDALNLKIQELAEQHGLSPDVVRATLDHAIPEELEQKMATVLADVGVFAHALANLDK